MDDLLFYDRVMEVKSEIVPKCEKCGGTGYVESPDDPYCECMVVLEYIMALIEANIPETYWDLEIDVNHMEPMTLKTMEYFVSNLNTALKRGLGIVFHGENGTGKTTAMCEIGKSAVSHNRRVFYSTVQQFITSIMDKDSMVPDALKRAELILLDEFEKVYIKSGSNYVQKTLEDFLRRALGGTQSLIICTNADEQRLEGVFGKSVISLLKRKMKYQEVIGTDYGETLQSLWEYKMTEKVHYFSKEILDKARVYHDYKLQEFYHE